VVLACKIDVTDWERTARPGAEQAVLNSLSTRAILPESLSGLWPAEPAGVEANDPLFVVRREHAFKKSPSRYPGRGPPIPQVAVAEVIRPSHKRLSLEICGWSLARKRVAG